MKIKNFQVFTEMGFLECGMVTKKEPSNKLETIRAALEVWVEL